MGGHSLLHHTPHTLNPHVGFDGGMVIAVHVCKPLTTVCVVSDIRHNDVCLFAIHVCLGMYMCTHW